VTLATGRSPHGLRGGARAGTLRLLLFAWGHGLALASRFDPALRSRVTRSFTLEVSADEGVARQWRFDGHRRRITTRNGMAAAPEHALRFARAGDALRALLSPRAIRHIVEGTQRGSVRLEGNAAVVLWFFGLTRRLVAIGREPGPRRALPSAYLRPDSRSNGDEAIPIEPACDELDHGWTRAWEQRAKLLTVRAIAGEPPPKV
jgi:hypothetical protein